MGLFFGFKLALKSLHQFPYFRKLGPRKDNFSYSVLLNGLRETGVMKQGRRCGRRGMFDKRAFSTKQKW